MPDLPGTRERLWQGILSSEEVEIYRRAGFLRPVTFGERPALLVIDAQYNYMGDRAEPVVDSSQRYRFSCGERAWGTFPYVKRLHQLAREKGIPIVYTQDQEQFPDPTPDEAARGLDIVGELAPEPGDVVIPKMGYSGFFCTRLLSYLVSLSVDTLIVCGGTTSGCVRATVTDAFDYRFKTFVVEECVFDRAAGPHRSNLFDIAGKAAMVLSLHELTEMLADKQFHTAFTTVGDSPVWRYVPQG